MTAERRSGRTAVQERWFLALATAVLLVALLGHLLAWPSPAALAMTIDHSNQLGLDFVKHYYPQGQGLLDEPTPVPGFFYSALCAVLLLPCRWLSLDAARQLWLVLQLLATALLCVWPARWLLRHTGSLALALLYVLVTATAYPVLSNLVWGQLSVFLGLLALAGALATADGHRRRGAALLAAAASIKYYPGLLLLQFALARQWRALLVAAGVGAGLLLVPIAVLGLTDTVHFQYLAAEALHGAGWIQRDPNSQYFGFVMARLTGVAAPWLWAGLGLAVVAAAARLLVALHRRAPGGEALLGPLLLLLTLPFVVVTSWPHYFVWLPFCQLWLLHRVRVEVSWRWGRGLLMAATIASLLLSNLAGLLLVGFWEPYNRLGALFWADVLLLLVAAALGRGRLGAAARGASELDLRVADAERLAP